MNLLCRKLVSQAWFLDEATWLALWHNAEKHDPTELQPMAERPEFDYYGEALPRPAIRGNLALIPIHGPLIKRASGFEKWLFSASSHEDIAADIDQAIEAGASKLLFQVNSPGGTSNGTPELASKIANLVNQGLELYSFSDTIQASAAEYLTAAVPERLGTVSGDFGSIGSILTLVNLGRLLQERGVEVNVFTSGPLKSTGHPLQAMSDRQREHVQQMVDRSAAQFKSWMAQYRPELLDEHMQGQTFRGDQAESIGLIDGVVSGELEAIEAAASG